MRHITALATALFVIAAMWVAAPAEADVDSFKLKDLGASASFYVEEECEASYVDVWASESVTRQKGSKPVTTAGAFLFVDRFNICTWETLLSAWGFVELQPGQFSIAKGLTRASLTVDLTLYDWVSDSDLPVSIDVDWVASGDKYQSRGVGHFRGPGYRALYRSRGTYQEAAATGAVVVNGTTVMSESSYAHMFNATSMNLQVMR